MADSFHWRTGSMRRIRKRVRCSDARHREPELDDRGTGFDEETFEHGRLLHEQFVLGVGAVAHHPLHPGPVVPGPVEQHDLTGRGKVRHVPLEVPLAPLALAGRLEGDDRRAPRVQVLGEPLDGAALARRVPPLEHDDDAPSLLLDPVLQPQQLDLEKALLGFVLRPGHALVIGVAFLPGVDQAPVLPAQDRLVLVVGLIELEVVQMEGKVDVEVHRRGRSRGTAHRSWGPGTPSG